MTIKWIIAFVFTLFACKPKNEVKWTETIFDFDHEIHSPVITISNLTSKVIEATAIRLEKNDGEDAVLTGDVTADFFNDQNEHMSILKADTAKINELTNNFTAIGNVVVKSDSGLVLRTKNLYWDHQYKLVISNDSVQFTTLEKDTLYGIGFESDMDLSHWKILQPTGVTARNIY